MTEPDNPDTDEFFNVFGLGKLPPSLTDVMKQFSTKEIEDAFSSALSNLLQVPASVSIKSLEYSTGDMFNNISISNMAIRPGSRSPDN